MGTIVLKMTAEQISTLQKDLANYATATKNPYASFSAKVDGISVIAYTSGKVTFQGAKPEVLASRFGYQAEPKHSPDGQNLALIGSDEVGNGSYFGGLAVVASLVTPADHAFLKSLGVDDSKNLNDIKIRQIAPILEEKIPHKALLLSPRKYNEVVGDGKSHNAVSVKVLSTIRLSFYCYNQVLNQIRLSLMPSPVRKIIKKYLRNERNRFDFPITLEEKAEGKYLAVAVSFYHRSQSLPGKS